MTDIEEKRQLIRDGLGRVIRDFIGVTFYGHAFSYGDGIDAILAFLDKNDVMICSQGGLGGSVLANMERLLDA